MKLTDAHIANRVSTSPNFMDLRRKMHRMRRLVAGDISALDDDGSTQSEDKMSGTYKPDAGDLYDILNRDFDEGRANVLLQSVRTLHLQVSLTHPDIEFEDLDTDMAGIHSLWFKSRMAPCVPQVKVKRCTANYLIDALGVAFCGMRSGSPVIDHVDPMDMTWDLTAETFDELNWAARQIRLPLWQWQEKFKNNEKLNELAIGNDNLDMPVTMIVYHDRTGLDTGNEAYFLSQGLNGTVSEDDLIERTKNLYSEYVGGVERTCVPYVFMNYMELPSVKVPISPVEMMLSAQIAMWAADRNIRDTIDMGAGMREYEEGAYDADELTRWMDGDRASLLKRKKTAVGMNQIEPMEVAQTVLAYRQQQEQNIIAQSGVDPYLSGNKVDNIEFAAQVNAIKGSAGLVAGSVAKDVSVFWQKIVKRTICNGHKFDEEPITLLMRDGADMLEYVFNKDNPIRDYLKPGSDIVISEDTLTFKPRDQKAQEALLDVQLGQALAPLGYTNFLPKALENYLRAKGEKNPGEWLEMQAPPMDPMMGGPAMDPAGDAQASTAA